MPGYPVSWTSNAWVQRLNGNGQKTGTSIVLRVMSGDKVSISADSWYASGVTPGAPSNLSVANLIASLAGGIAGSGGASHSVAQIQQNPNLQSGLGSFLTNVVNADNAANGNLPKSYLNYVLFDEQLNVVITNDGKNSGIDRVGSGGALKSHQITQRPITRNGYLYIYVSNETPALNVIFDNLKVTHVRGELTEETHYYPFGLTIAGISSRAMGKLVNRFKYNNKELQNKEFFDGTGLELYDNGKRMLDPQVGRWGGVDPLADSMRQWSPYNYVFDNPLKLIDPDGRGPEKPNPLLQKAQNAQKVSEKLNAANENFFGAFSFVFGVSGAVVGAGGEVAAGPIKVGAELGLITGGISLKNTTIKAEGAWLELSGGAGFGGAKAEANASFLSGETKVELKDMSVSFDGALVDGSAKAKDGKVSLSNSLNLGASIKIMGGKIGGNVDIYKLGQAAAGYLDAGIEYLSGKISEAKSWFY